MRHEKGLASASLFFFDPLPPHTGKQRESMHQNHHRTRCRERRDPKGFSAPVFLLIPSQALRHDAAHHLLRLLLPVGGGMGAGPQGEARAAAARILLRRPDTVSCFPASPILSCCLPGHTGLLTPLCRSCSEHGRLFGTGRSPRGGYLAEKRRFSQLSIPLGGLRPGPASVKRVLASFRRRMERRI